MRVKPLVHGDVIAADVTDDDDDDNDGCSSGGVSFRKSLKRSSARK